MRRRWTPATKALAVLAVVCGLAAFALVNDYQRQLERLRPAVGTPVAVVVATDAVPRGSTLDAAELRVDLVPSSFAPPGRFGRSEDVAGRTTLTDLAPGEPVTATRLAPPGGPIAALAPPGSVGFPIRVDVPPRAVRPGDLVDVLATFGGHRPHTETVAEAVPVLLVLAPSTVATDGFTGADSPTLVLAATGDLSERLAYAGAFAQLSVAIRPAPPEPPA